MINSARWCIAGILLQAVVWVRPASAELVPARGEVDGRIRHARYDRDQVYRLRGFVGYQIDLEFEGGETFVGLGAGDLEGLAYYAQDNHLFLKPKASRIDTNLTVLTNRRQYQFDYSAAARPPADLDTEVIFALRFAYPSSPDKEAQREASRRVDEDLKRASAQRPQNVDYWYCGVRALRPVHASDDGVHTRLRFAANRELPAIFVRSDDGTETLLNYSMDAGDIIIHRVAPGYLLRRGRETGCIVNRGYVGTGTRLESGTVAPAVERRVQGAAP